MAVVAFENRPVPKDLYSADDLWEFPSDTHYELISGELRPMSMPTGDEHGKKRYCLPCI